MKTVHQSYLMALTDERAILKQAIADGEDIATLARDMLANCNATLRKGWSGDMLQYMRGTRDFWALQASKYGCAA